MKNMLLLGLAVSLFGAVNAQRHHHGGHHHHHRNNKVVVVRNHRAPVQIRVNVGLPIRRSPVCLTPRPRIISNNCNLCNHNRGCDHHNNANRYGSYSEFNELIYQLRSANFESDKLIIAKQAVRGHAYSADQIGNIMMEFGYESSRLEFAKFAYGFCLDPENYYQVNSAFQFSSSIDELDQFIR